MKPKKSLGTTTTQTLTTTPTTATTVLLPRQQVRLDAFVRDMIRKVKPSDMPADFYEWQWTGKIQLERLSSHAAIDAQIDLWDRSLSSIDVESDK